MPNLEGSAEMSVLRIVFTVCCLWLVLGNVSASADPPLCTTHFFDWYVVSDQRPLEQQQRLWTYRVDWQAFGITPEEIGNSVHYYEVQFRKILEAGFDGVHYEWHNNNPKPQFIEAAKKVRLPLAMFYDMQIRFSGRPSFITPTDEFAKQVVQDVLSFYGSVPKTLWLHDRNGKIPIVVYGYAFDQTVTDPKRWDKFYQTIIKGIEGGLDEQIVFHWTNTNTPQQMYGYQHFPQIQSYIFNEVSGQTQANAHCVTFVVHYDDLGVSFARKGSRARRWIRNDIRYLQEALWLAKHTNPDLVFNYGWNELYEGEHLLPDDHWGTWRYELASAMVKAVKSQTKADLPRALIFVDDFLPALHSTSPDRAAMLRREMNLLTRLRAFVPQAEVVLPDAQRNLSDYEIIFSLNMTKDESEEEALAKCGRKVIYVNPDVSEDGPMTQLFTSQPRRPLKRPNLGPINEYIVATHKTDVDLTRFPFLSFRYRNTPGALVHIRYYGLNAAGQEVPAWYESSPTDDRQTQGKWVEQKVNVAEIAKRGAGQDTTRLTRIEIILDDLEKNGDFSLDVDYLRMVDQQGNAAWEHEFKSISGWTFGTSFPGAPNAASRFGFSAKEEDGRTMGHMTLTAISSDALIGPIDEATRDIKPREEANVLYDSEFNGVRIPIVLQRDDCYQLNTYSPTEDCWKAFMPKLVGATLNRGVTFRSYSHAVQSNGMTSQTDDQWTVIQEEELPINRIRLAAPPELDHALPFTLPISSRPISLRVIRGNRPTIPFPDPNSTPPTITLEPGEVVELVRGE